ncbi:Zinc finger protein CONSTANS-LIKE 13 [Hordeum vulgare]|nr:Zinc finger protein CONSTANS-LIKE 13 [Hordeum vulgare]
MQDLRRQHPELMDAETMIFADGKGSKVIMLFCDDEINGDEDDGAEGIEVAGDDKEIDVDEWRSVFPKARRRHRPGPGSRHIVHDEEGLARPPLQPNIV